MKMGRYFKLYQLISSFFTLRRATSRLNIISKHRPWHQSKIIKPLLIRILLRRPAKHGLPLLILLCQSGGEWAYQYIVVLDELFLLIYYLAPVYHHCPHGIFNCFFYVLIMLYQHLCMRSLVMYIM